MDHMKLKRKEDQRVDASVLLRRGDKIIKGSRGWKGRGRKRGEGREKIKRQNKNQELQMRMQMPVADCHFCHNFPDVCSLPLREAEGIH